jgi:hypothetical protein
MNGHPDHTPLPAPLARGNRQSGEESIVADARAGLTPAQVVENKLHALLRGTALPMSRTLVPGGRGPTGR